MIENNLMKITKSKIILDHVRIFAHHGVFPQERQTGANFFISVEATTDFSTSLRSDELGQTVSYADLYAIIKAEMAIPSKLLEHVAGRILKQIFSQCPAVEHLRIELCKENPPMGADCRYAGIVLEADR